MRKHTNIYAYAILHHTPSGKLKKNDCKMIFFFGPLNSYLLYILMLVTAVSACAIFRPCARSQ